MAEWKRICCAVDFSGPSREAVEEAAHLARRLEAELVLLHVYDPHAASPELLLTKLERAALELEGHLADWGRAAEGMLGRAVRTVLLTGPAAQEIARFARDGEFDLLVIAPHGRTGLARMLLGSVVKQVLREASCPVLVVRRRGGAAPADRPER